MTTPLSLDADACYRACAGRDERWDGHVYLGVRTTGIYCRPSCPARMPQQENCEFFATSAAAVAAGFRACKRCRPDALPGTRRWDTHEDTASRAMRMIRDGVVDDEGVTGLARRLSLSERQIHRIMVTEVGATVQQLNRTRRAHTARMLIEQTALSLADVAFSAGFGSVRQFNDVMRSEFGAAPSTFRRPSAKQARPAPAETAEVTLRLAVRTPWQPAALQRFCRAHAIPGVETIDTEAHTHSRVIRSPHGVALVTVIWDHRAEGPDAGSISVRFRMPDLSDLTFLVGAVRRWLDLDADPAVIDAALSLDPLLAPLIRQRPGLRLPGAIDGAETALLTVLGQQVSLAAARRFSGRLVAAYGDPTESGLVAFPLPARLAAAPVAELRAVVGLTQARARTMHSLASALANGLSLTPHSDRASTREALLAIPGIGPWTADYITLRALGDPDAFVGDDLIAKRTLGVAHGTQARQLAAAWSPWRGYALMHLWTKEVYS